MLSETNYNIANDSYFSWWRDKNGKTLHMASCQNNEARYIRYFQC